jgi:hypothetical protein
MHKSTYRAYLLGYNVVMGVFNIPNESAGLVTEMQAAMALGAHDAKQMKPPAARESVESDLAVMGEFSESEKPTS